VRSTLIPSEDRVERGGELHVSVAEQQPELADTAFELHEQVAGLLYYPPSDRVRCHREHVDSPSSHLEHEQDI
jgi:hypothetical protein